MREPFARANRRAKSLAIVRGEAAAAAGFCLFARRNRSASASGGGRVEERPAAKNHGGGRGRRRARGSASTRSRRFGRRRGVFVLLLLRRRRARRAHLFRRLFRTLRRLFRSFRRLGPFRLVRLFRLFRLFRRPRRLGRVGGIFVLGLRGGRDDVLAPPPPLDAKRQRLLGALAARDHHHRRVRARPQRGEPVREVRGVAGSEIFPGGLREGESLGELEPRRRGGGGGGGGGGGDVAVVRARSELGVAPREFLGRQESPATVRVAGDHLRGVERVRSGDRGDRGEAAVAREREQGAALLAGVEGPPRARLVRHAQVLARARVPHRALDALVRGVGVARAREALVRARDAQEGGVRAHLPVSHGVPSVAHALADAVAHERARAVGRGGGVRGGGGGGVGIRRARGGARVHLERVERGALERAPAVRWRDEREQRRDREGDRRPSRPSGAGATTVARTRPTARSRGRDHRDSRRGAAGERPRARRDAREAVVCAATCRVDRGQHPQHPRASSAHAGVHHFVGLATRPRRVTRPHLEGGEI